MKSRVTENKLKSNMNIEELLKKFDEAIELAYAAVDLAQEYAGNESETADAIAKNINKLVRDVKKI
jgi:hypothetical protein